jgi:hypothetical protein
MESQVQGKFIIDKRSVAPVAKVVSKEAKKQQTDAQTKKVLDRLI